LKETTAGKIFQRLEPGELGTEIGIYYTYMIVFSDYVVFEGTNYLVFVQLCVILGYSLSLHHNGKHVL
jgi:hypothetical protein